MERPIIFSGAMIRAIIDGRKTQTRRVWKPRYHSDARLLRRDTVDSMPAAEAAAYLARVSVCPYGAPGDTLWVRETWRTLSCSRGAGEPCEVQYRAGGIEERAAKEPVGRDIIASERGPGESTDPLGRAWRPSIFMPRWASRLTLRIESVRVERLHDISEEDALAEGITWDPGPLTGPARSEFAAKWDTINGRRAPWASNPWVWVVTFAPSPRPRDGAVDSAQPQL